MKALLLLCLPLGLLAQMPMDSSTHKFTYTGVVDVPGMTKTDLYVAARSWFVSEYRSADDVIQMEDKEAGRIIGKGFSLVQWQMATRYVKHTVQIDLKDGKYRYIVTDFAVKMNAYLPFESMNSKQYWNISKLHDETDKDAQQTIQSLKQHMTKASSTKKDDW